MNDQTYHTLLRTQYNILTNLGMPRHPRLQPFVAAGWLLIGYPNTDSVLITDGDAEDLIVMHAARWLTRHGCGHELDVVFARMAESPVDLLIATARDIVPFTS